MSFVSALATHCTDPFLRPPLTSVSPAAHAATSHPAQPEPNYALQPIYSLAQAVLCRRKAVGGDGPLFVDADPNRLCPQAQAGNFHVSSRLIRQALHAALWRSIRRLCKATFYLEPTCLRIHFTLTQMLRRLPVRSEACFDMICVVCKGIHECKFVDVDVHSATGFAW